MNTLRTITAAGILALFAGSASAAVINQSFDVAPGLANSGTAVFDRFDASKGVLKGVTLTMSADFLSKIYAESNGIRDAVIREAYLEDTYFRFASDFFEPIKVEVVDGSFGGLTSTEKGVRVFSDPIERSHSVTLTALDGLNLSDFSGTGQIVVQLGVFSNGFGFEEDGIFHRMRANGNGIFGIQTDHALSADLSYEFAPVPLPAAGWLLIAATGGLGLYARRKKAATIA